MQNSSTSASDNPSPNQKREFFHSLHFMRGVLAVWVVVFHMDHNVMPVLLEIPLLRRAYLSVDAFFVLSGFMLAYTYKDKFKYQLKLDEWKKYMWMRVARIYPLYFVNALIPFIYLPPVQYVWILTRLTFISAIFDQTILGQNFVNPPSWSVCDEFIIYLVFPFMIIQSINNKGDSTIFSVSVIAFLISFTIWFQGSSFNGSFYIITLFGYEFKNTMYLNGTLEQFDGYFAWIRVINGYLLGILVFQQFEKNKINRENMRKYFYSKICFALIVFLLVGMIIMNLLIGNSNNFQITISIDFLMIIIFALLIYYLSLENDTFSQLSQFKISKILGDISYTIYICQWPYLQFQYWFWLRFGSSSFILQALFISATSLVYGCLCYVIFLKFEMPAKKFIQDLSKKSEFRSKDSKSLVQLEIPVVQ